MVVVRRRASTRSSGAGRTVVGALLWMVLAGACATNTSGGSAPTSVGALLTSGLRAQASGDLSRADADYLSVVKAEPQNTLAWYNLGVIAQQRHDDDVAVADYGHAVAANARYVPALYNLAILKTASDPKLAARLYQRSITIEPNDANAY